MEQSLALRFDRIIKENLPKRKGMVKILIENAMPADLFYKKGNGVQSILKKNRKTYRLQRYLRIHG